MDDVRVTPFFIRMLKGLPAAIAPLIVFIVIVSGMGKFGISRYRSWKASGGSVTGMISDASRGVMIEPAPVGSSQSQGPVDCQRDDICYLRYGDVIVSGWCDLDLPECGE